MLFLITVPANNTRGPRYMEKSLAAMHQARLRHPVSLIYGSTDEQVGLFVRCHAVDRDAVLQPILANYPHATVTLSEAGSRTGECTIPEVEVWHSDVQLVPELFPILRHAQFEDALNHNFADPVSGLFRAILPETQMSCRIEICIQPATRRRCHEARASIQLLDREFFRKHHRLAIWFARRNTRPRRWKLARLLGLLARCTPQPNHTTLETSASRLHEREDDLLAASEKLGGHLFETTIRLSVEVTAGLAAQHGDRLRRMAGALWGQNGAIRPLSAVLAKMSTSAGWHSLDSLCCEATRSRHVHVQSSESPGI